MKIAHCRSCGADIVWMVTGSGKREPVDAEPREDGNIEITGATVVEENDGSFESAPTVRHLKKGEGLTLLEPPLRYVSHFSTCPQTQQHRRK